MNKVKIIRAATVPQSLDSFCKGLLKELSKSYDVVALSSPGDSLTVISQREGVRTIAVPMARHIKPFKDLLSLFALIKVFRQERPHVVHSMTPKAGLLCMMAAWWTRVPIRIHTFTGLVFPTSRGVQRRLLMLTDRITCKCATNIIPEGEGVKSDLIRYNITRKPLRVLGYGNVRGVDMTYYDKTPEVLQKASLLKDPLRFTFLYVGRIVRDKGINELIDAFMKINKDYNARLVLVGDYETALDPISHLSQEAISNNDSICVVGRKNGTDLLAYYAASDCFVFPSYREGFPNTVLEAGAFSLPSIVTDINGSREIIINGYNGIVIPSHDPEALYQAMKRIMDCPEERKAMESVSRKHIQDHFEQGFVWKCLFDYYKSIL